MGRTKKSLSLVDIPMGEYETDLTWMAYRYAIGRHTIASCMMAHDMAKHIYDRMPEERKEFTAYDIRRQIGDCLNCHAYLSYHLDWSFNQEEYKPLEYFIKYFMDNDIHTKSEVERISSIHVSKNNNTKEVEYRVSYSEVRPTSSLSISNMDVEDLLCWMDLANALDSKSHKKCRLTNGDVVEYFESYYVIYKETEVFKFVKYRRVLDDYVHGNGNAVIPDDLIAEDNI